MDWIGARWWKFDFHCHTPASEDYGKGEDQEKHKSILPKEWLLNYMRAKIDCVAITDHNTGAWVDRLKAALLELSAEKHEDFRQIYIFPGVEISASDGAHILAILPEDKTTSDIDSLLGAVGFRGNKGDCSSVVDMSSAQVIETITKFEGLAIPAHTDQERGIFSVPSSSLKQVLDRPDVFAMEIGDIQGAKPQLYYDKKLSWSEVLGSDSHHPVGDGDQSFPGSHYTWVKMSTPSFEGLRLALLDGELSIRRSDKQNIDPNSHGDPMIERIVVSNAKYIGRANDFVCQFNPWLNSIIGGRGTGKSTTIELLRHALERDNEIPKNLSADFSKYREISKGNVGEGLLTEDTKVSVYYQKDQARFRVDWINRENPKAFIETERGEWEETPGSIAQRFPIRVYSQKQIFELAKDPDSLMRIIDDAPEINYKEWKNRWDELCSRYMTIQASIRETLAGLDGEATIKGELDDIKRKLDIFQKSGHEDILKDYHDRNNQKRTLDSWEASWSSWSNEIQELIAKLVFREVSFGDYVPPEDENKELQAVIELLNEELRSVKVTMTMLAGKLDSMSTSWQRRRAELKLTAEIAQATTKYEALIAELKEKGAGAPSAYGDLVVEEQRLNARLQAISEKRTLLERQEEEAKQLLAKLTDHRKDLTKKRSDFIRETLSGNEHVQIEVIQFGNKSSLEEGLREVLGRNDSSFDRDIKELLSELTATEEPNLTQIDDIKKMLKDIYNAEDQALEFVRDTRFAHFVQGLDPESLDRLSFWFPDDSVKVSFRLRGNNRFISIAEGSPGQKTAALLAFILSYGGEPLILDQPEDDLDNQLIYDLIVQQLRHIKRQRQVIVVTHNANIVVNGDAENVIALDIRRGQTQIVAQGGLQETAIREKICELMEGGTRAFEERYRRINLSPRITVTV